MNYSPDTIEQLLEEKNDFPQSNRRKKARKPQTKKPTVQKKTKSFNGIFPISPQDIQPYLLEVHSRNEAQKELIYDLTHNEVVCISGIAGTGKTFLTISHCVELLCQGAVRKIILTRPAVEADEHIGFLPGGIREKLDPYLYPLYDSLEEKLQHVPGGPKRVIENWISAGILEIAPLGFMRGRTFCDSAVLLDECQNSTYSQLKMFMTRIGEGSYMYLNGDLQQSDIGLRSGYKELLDRLYQEIPIVGFANGDCVRSEQCRKLTRLLS